VHVRLKQIHPENQTVNMNLFTDSCLLYVQVFH